MSPHPIIALTALKTITLLLGGLITYLAYKAHRRSGARPLWYLAVGFGIVTMGLLLAGVSPPTRRCRCARPSPTGRS